MDTTPPMEIPDAYLQDWRAGAGEYETDLAHEKGLDPYPTLLDFDSAMRAALSAAADIYQ